MKIRKETTASFFKKMNVVRPPFKGQARAECFMCRERFLCMKVGPTNETRVCRTCYTHPCYEGMLDDIFDACAQEIENRIDAAYVEDKRT